MSRKQKALEFIRIKNDLRAGIRKFYLMEEISEKITTQPKQLKKLIKLMHKVAIKSLKTNYNLDYSSFKNAFIDVSFGTINDMRLNGEYCIRAVICLNKR